MFTWRFSWLLPKKKVSKRKGEAVHEPIPRNKAQFPRCKAERKALSSDCCCNPRVSHSTLGLPWWVPPPEEDNRAISFLYLSTIEHNATHCECKIFSARTTKQLCNFKKREILAQKKQRQKDKNRRNYWKWENCECNSGLLHNNFTRFSNKCWTFSCSQRGRFHFVWDMWLVN